MIVKAFAELRNHTNHTKFSFHMELREEAIREVFTWDL